MKSMLNIHDNDYSMDISAGYIKINHSPIKKGCLLLMIVSHCFFAISQEQLLDELTTYLTEENLSHSIIDFEETIAELYSNPININTCDETELEKTGIFSAFQSYNIIQYRMKYGKFLSIYELASIPSLSVEYIRIIYPLLCVSAKPTGQKKYKPTGSLLSNISIKTPLSMAFDSTSSESQLFTGSPEKQVHRIKGSAGKITAALTIEKDPGEKWINDKNPEHCTGYIRYAPGKIIDEVILGNFKVHSGLGLVHGLGFNTKGSGIQSNGYRKSFARPYASTLEYDYYRGLYTSFKKGKIQTGMYISSKPEDMSFFRFDPSYNLFGMIKRTGYHRTKSEAESIRLGNSISTGISFNYIEKKGNIGIALSESYITLTEKAVDSLDLSDYNKPKRTSLSIYGVKYNLKSEVYFEASLDGAFNHALLAGMRTRIHPAFTLYSSVRNYGAGFKGMMPSAYGAYDHPQNSAGINTGLQIVPFRYYRLSFDSDITRSKMALQSESPFGYDIANHMTLKISRGNTSAFEIRIQNKPGNAALDKSIYTGGKNKIQVKYSGELENRLLYETKWITTISGTEESRGNVFYQQIATPSEKDFRIKYRFMVFNAPDYENRIYLYEPGLKYSFLFPAWQGKGTQNIFIFNGKLSYHITLRSKISFTHYSHKHETGSAGNLRHGNRIFSFEIQLQADL